MTAREPPVADLLEGSPPLYAERTHPGCRRVKPNVMRSRLLVTAFVGALGVVATFTALAWACTPQAYIDIPGASGPPGTSVSVTGRGFVAAPVEITWSGGGVLGTATGPDFAVTVKIPEAAPGVYYITATARDTASGVTGHATRAFEVVAPPAPTVVEAPGGPRRRRSRRLELETSGATRPAPSATRGERGLRADTPTAQTAEVAAPVAATSRPKRGRGPGRSHERRQARGGPREHRGSRALYSATRAARAVRLRQAVRGRPAGDPRRRAPRVGAAPGTGSVPADDGPGWPLAAALALLGYGVLTLLTVAAPRVACAVAARRPGATELPVDEVVLPDDLLERLGAVLEGAAGEAPGRTEEERPLNV